MPMPTTMEMNITEKMLRWPMTSVMMPIDQARLTISVASISTGLTKRRKAPMRSSHGEHEGEDRRHLAVVEGGGHLVVRDGRAARHTRLDSGKVGRGGAAMVRRMASMVLRLSAKLPSSRRCCTNRNSQCLSEEKK